MGSTLSGLGNGENSARGMTGFSPSLMSWFFSFIVYIKTHLAYLVSRPEINIQLPIQFFSCYLSAHQNHLQLPVLRLSLFDI